MATSADAWDIVTSTRWRSRPSTSPRLDIARLVSAGCRSKLGPEVLAAYDAPFPDETFKAGPRAMPNLVPTSLDDPASAANIAAWQRLSALDIPFLVAFSDSDPITGPMAPVLRAAVPGAANVAHPTITSAGHFLQEDAGKQLAEAIVTFVRDHPG